MSSTPYRRRFPLGDGIGDIESDAPSLCRKDSRTVAHTYLDRVRILGGKLPEDCFGYDQLLLALRENATTDPVQNQLRAEGLPLFAVSPDPLEALRRLSGHVLDRERIDGRSEIAIEPEGSRRPVSAVRVVAGGDVEDHVVPGVDGIEHQIHEVAPRRARDDRWIVRGEEDWIPARIVAQEVAE